MQEDQNNPLDPGLVDYAQQWDNEMQKAFKGIHTRKQRRAMMTQAMRRRVREEQADA